MLGRHGWVGVALLLAALDLLLVYPAVLGGRVLAPEDVLLFHAPLSVLHPAGLARASNYLLSDAVEVFHPDLEWARLMLRGGHLPLWDPYVFGGWPVLASQQTAILYPLNWLAYVLPFWPALGLIVALKTLLAGLGVYWLARRLRMRVPAALLAAITYSLGSYFVIWLEHPHSNVYALIGWLLGAIDLVCLRRRARDAGLLAAVVGLCLLGGQPESAFIAMLACVAFAILRLAGLAGADERRRALGLLTGAVVLGGAAGAVMLIPFTELAGQAPDLGRGGGSGLPARSWLSLILPDLWGRPEGFEAVGPANYAERTFYVGVLPLMLAAAGLYRARPGAHRFFAGLLVGAAVLAVHLPVVTEAVVNAPLLELIALDRSLILVVLCIAMLAGFGLDRLLDAGRGQRRVMLGLAGAVACAPIAWLAPQSRVVSAFPRFSDLAPSLWGTAVSQAQTAAAAGTRWLVFAIPALGILGLLAHSRSRLRSGVTALGLALAIGLVATDLLALGNGYHPAIPERLADPPATPSIVAAQAGQADGRAIGYDAYLIPNVFSRYGLRDARGHGLPALGRYLALWTGLGGYGFQQTRLLPGDRRAGDLLDEFAVTEVLVGRGETPPPGLRQVAGYPDGTLLRNEGALPRAYLATAWRTAPTAAAALGKTLVATPAGLRAAPVIEGVAPAASVPAHPPAGGPPDAGTIRFAQDGGDVVSLDVTARRTGYLILLDNYYPGWRVTVDGRAATIHPANAAFRAVALGPGRHRVEFTYRPAAILAAGTVSGLAWFAILALLVVPRVRGLRSRRRRPVAAVAGP